MLKRLAKVKPGDLLYLEGLVCRVETVDEVKISAWVISGAWRLWIYRDGSTSMCDTPYGPSPIAAGLKRVFPAGTWPSDMGYRELFEWVDLAIERPIRAWFLIRLRKIQTLVARFKRAAQAFDDAWNGVEDVEDED